MKILLEPVEEGSLLLHVTGRTLCGDVETEIFGGFVTGFFKKLKEENEEQIAENRAIHMRICL